MAENLPARVPTPPLIPAWMAEMRVAFGLLLLIDGVLEFQPATYQVFDSLIYSNASVSPEPLRQALVAVAQLIAQQPALCNGILAGVEVALALAILLGVWTRAALLLALPLFAGIWVFGQGVGLPFAAGTTDLNSGLLYIMLVLMLLAGRSWERLSVFAWVRRDAPDSWQRRSVVAFASALTILLLGVLTWGSISAVDAQPGQAGPPAVGGASLSFDAQVGVDVLVGGCNTQVCSGATWLWDGHRWLRDLSTPAPPPLGYAGSAYDAITHEVVLYGGAEQQGLGPALATTWAWSQRWRRLDTPPAPSGRRFAALAYDPNSHQLLLFGGDNAAGQPLGGTWVLARGRWALLAPPSAPSARTACAMAWDPSLGEIILYGGSDETSRLSGTWGWNGVTWTRLRSLLSPGPLAYAAMATDPLTGSVLLFAGTGRSDSTWVWGTSGWRAVHSEATPPVYSFASMAQDPAGRGVLLYGGATSSGSGFSAQTWLWTASGWNRISG